jgi:U4/U6 small nuclear ribonucleoprotein PRP31
MVQEACHLSLTYEEARQKVTALQFCIDSKIMEYVESKMVIIAPNLSAIVGSSIAAKMMGQVGGLAALSRMPSSSIQVSSLQASLILVFGFS